MFMIPYWLYYSMELVFVGSKYGPFYKNIPASCYTFDIHDDCPNFWMYIAQLIFYAFIWVIVFVCYCTKGNRPLGCQIHDRYRYCDQLLFPMVILFFLFFVGIGVLSTRETNWYLIQMFIDLLGYMIWFAFVFIPPTVIHELSAYFKNDKILYKDGSLKMLIFHTIFLLVILVDFLWVLYSLLDEDFHFEEIGGDNQFIFIQIILENVLILEWIHFVIEDLTSNHYYDDISDPQAPNPAGKSNKVKQKPAPHDDDIKNNDDSDINIDGDDINLVKISVPDDNAAPAPDPAPVPAPDPDPEVLTNWNILFCLFLFGIFQIAFEIVKIFHEQSNFSMFIEEAHNYLVYVVWILQPIVNGTLFLIISFTLFNNPKQAKDLYVTSLWFPFIIFIIFFILQSSFGFWVNQWYFLQMITDTCGYFIFFVFALFCVRYRMYYDCCKDTDTIKPCIVTIIGFTMILYIILVALGFWRTLMEDLSSARKAIALLGGDTKLKITISFIGIILENTLIVEWFHVLVHNASPCNCNN